MTNGQIILALNTINRIKEEDRRLPVRLSFALNKNLQTLLAAYKPYEESLKEMGLSGVDAETLAGLDDEKKKAFAELFNIDCEVDLTKVSLSDIDGANLSVNEMEVIQTFMMDE